jgi:hypothetical protein
MLRAMRNRDEIIVQNSVGEGTVTSVQHNALLSGKSLLLFVRCGRPRHFSVTFSPQTALHPPFTTQTFYLHGICSVFLKSSSLRIRFKIRSKKKLSYDLNGIVIRITVPFSTIEKPANAHLQHIVHSCLYCRSIHAQTICLYCWSISKVDGRQKKQLHLLFICGTLSTFGNQGLEM